MKDILDKVKKIMEEKVVPMMKKIGPKAKDLFEKIKEFAKKVIPFVLKHKRYFATGLIFVGLVCVLFFFTGEAFNAKRIAKLNSREVTGEQYQPADAFDVDAYPEVNDLIKKYFTAYVNADFATLETIATPISDMEKSYITTMSQFYEEYRNVVCYTKHGLSKDSYIVSACFDIKFAGHDLTAPSMLLFYVQTAEDGSLYINNLYSDFNMYYSQEPIRKEVYTALVKYTTQEDYLDLYTSVETAFNNLIKENTDVYQLTKRTIPGVRQQWEDSVYYVEQPEETTQAADTQTPESTEAPTEAPSETPETTAPDGVTGATSNIPDQNEPETEEAENRVEKVRCIKNDVNVRKKASPNGSRLGKAQKDNKFIKLGEETDENGDKWTKIQFTDDEVGYIISTYVEEIDE